MQVKKNSEDSHYDSCNIIQVLCFFGTIIGAIIMLVYSSICLSTENYDICGGITGTYSLMITGLLIIICCFCITNRNKVDSQYELDTV